MLPSDQTLEAQEFDIDDVAESDIPWPRDFRSPVFTELIVPSPLLGNSSQAGYMASSSSEAPQLPPASSEQPQWNESVETLVIKHLPDRFTKARLAQIWPPERSWNLLHLPWSTSQRRRVSYLFINFVSAEAARAFYTRWQGRMLSTGPRARPLDIKPADVQGYWANVIHIYCKLESTGEITNAKSKPLIIGDGGQYLDLRDVMASRAALGQCEFNVMSF